MTAIGILGGSFDPPHIAHLILAQEALVQRGLDKVLFVPAHQPPHKLGARLADGDDRLEMVRRAIAGNDRFGVCDIELARAGVSYSYDTAVALRAQFGDACRLEFIVGADAIGDFPGWKNAAGLAEVCTIVIATRPGFDLQQLDSLKSLFGEERLAELTSNCMAIPQMTISSTELRARVRAGRPIRYLTPPAVEAYIRERGLYVDG